MLVAGIDATKRFASDDLLFSSDDEGGGASVSEAFVEDNMLATEQLDRSNGCTTTTAAPSFRRRKLKLELNPLKRAGFVVTVNAQIGA